MFIELTDHLRCPASHEEQYLVLLPDEIVARSVRAGLLSCPVCGSDYRIEEGIARFGGAPAEPAGESALTGEAIAPLVGLGGPGGYLVVVGAVGARWREIAEQIPGVGIVAVNPPGEVADQPGVPVLSVVQAGLIPLKARSVRAVVLGPGYASWAADAGRVVLPGRRVVGEGAAPPDGGLALLASADGVWVAERS